MGTACYVKGSDRILTVLEKELGIHVGETTADQQISLMSARCLGACGIAPAMIFDGMVVGKQEPDMAIEKVKSWQVEANNHSSFVTS
jgi:bidirectional [NiFe] hydrogenase diaphorase subunit